MWWVFQIARCPGCDPQRRTRSSTACSAGFMRFGSCPFLAVAGVFGFAWTTSGSHRFACLAYGLLVAAARAAEGKGSARPRPDASGTCAALGSTLLLPARAVPIVRHGLGGRRVGSMLPYGKGNRAVWRLRARRFCVLEFDSQPAGPLLGSVAPVMVAALHTWRGLEQHSRLGPCFGNSWAWRRESG